MNEINEITHTIIGCAMKIHATMGNGFQEVVYQRALEIEFKKAELSYQRELEMQLTYDDQIVGTRRLDFLVEDQVLVELKSLSQLEPVHVAQAINYCEAYNVANGLLINFGASSLEFRRIYNKKMVKPNERYSRPAY
jgi:GxxExxY protein